MPVRSCRVNDGDGGARTEGVRAARTPRGAPPIALLPKVSADGCREIAYIALGSNLGDRARYLAQARAALAALPDTRILATSAVEETEPIGPVPQGPYLNQMIALETGLSPRALLDALHRIEQDAGRTRAERWGPRTLDLDIVLFGTCQIREPDLVIPHPELPNRDFWRRELTELMTVR
jgi:2-amino-4-hydroxy-6-hydroxymethyldihydropteridine diphosphokinase